MKKIAKKQKAPYTLSLKFVKTLSPEVVQELKEWVKEYEGDQDCHPVGNSMSCKFTFHGITPVRNKSGKRRVFPLRWRNEEQILNSLKSKEESKDSSNDNVSGKKA